MAEETRLEQAERVIAHPPARWCFSFIHSADPAEVAEFVQHYLGHGYKLHGDPFVFNGMIYQALLYGADDIGRLIREEEQRSGFSLW